MKKRLAVLICALVLLILTACEASTTQTAEPSPISTVEATPIPSPLPVPSQESEQEPSKFPVLAAQNRKWSVYIDAWGSTESGGNAMDISIYAWDGTLFQKLSHVSLQPGPMWEYLEDPRFEQPVALGDLNFDGLPDIRIMCNTTRCTTYRAFLWNKEMRQFVEEPTFEEIRRPYPMQGMIFGNCSGGASNTAFSAYAYDKEYGYQLVRHLSMDTSYDNEWDGTQYTETFYKNGEIVNTVQTMDDLSKDEFWRDYNDFTDEYVFG